MRRDRATYYSGSLVAFVDDADEPEDVEEEDAKDSEDAFQGKR